MTGAFFVEVDGRVIQQVSYVITTHHESSQSINWLPSCGYRVSELVMLDSTRSCKNYSHTRICHQHMHTGKTHTLYISCQRSIQGIGNHLYLVASYTLIVGESRFLKVIGPNSNRAASSSFRTAAKWRPFALVSPASPLLGSGYQGCTPEHFTCLTTIYYDPLRSITIHYDPLRSITCVFLCAVF